MELKSTFDPGKPACFRHKGKSQEHVAVQRALVAALPIGEAQQERAFPAISRVADVVWLPRRVVFEVQCSPISLREVLSRSEEYASQGFQVVWVLHEKNFNRDHLSPSEIFLRGQRSYFTNIDHLGRGEVYDQTEKIVFNRRYFKGEAYRVDIQLLPKRKRVIKPRKPKFSLVEELSSFCRYVLLYFLKKASKESFRG